MGTTAVDKHWSPSPALVVIGWLFTAAVVLAAVLSPQAMGKLLLGVAALLLALLALHGSVARPRLAAADQGLAVRGLLTTRHFEWPATQIRIRHIRRFGRDTSTLELESGQTLVVLGRLDLGADPEDVAAALRSLRS
ncbi:MAG: PH domain-containing protein [Sciscionella sp.]